jgi:hypothetical protein
MVDAALASWGRTLSERDALNEALRAAAMPDLQARPVPSDVAP